MSSYGNIKSGRLITVKSGHYPQMQMGLDASKTTNPSIGDLYYATDTGLIYNCFVVNIWSLSGATLAGFNLLKMYTTNIFSETKTGTGSIVSDAIAGTLTFSLPTNGDDIFMIETDKIAPSLLPRIMIFGIDTIVISGGDSTCSIGFGDGIIPINEAFINTSNGGVTWTFVVQNTALEGQAEIIDSPKSGDIYIIYFTSARAVLFKNGVYLKSLIGAGVPTDPVSHFVQFRSIAGQGAGNVLKLRYMS